MKSFRLCLLLMFFYSSSLLAQEIEVIKFPRLQEIMNERSDKIKLINFWATWCKPCIEELPYFEKANNKYDKEKLEVILVSLDFVEDLDTKVKTFVTKKKLSSKLYLLDETDFDDIINKVDPGWSGAIPATLIIDGLNQSKSFYEKQFKKGELDEIINQVIN